MPSGAQFKLTKTAIEDIALYISQFEIEFPKKYPKYSEDNAWRESDFGRDTYDSLKRRSDKWRQRPTVDKVSEKLDREVYQVVLVVDKDGTWMSPYEYFEIEESAEEQSKRIFDKLLEMRVSDRDFIEAFIELLPDFMSSKMELAELPTGGHGIVAKPLMLDHENIVEEAKKRRPKKKKGLGLAPANSVGVITVGFLERIEGRIQRGEPVEIPLPALYDLSFALKVLPSSLTRRDAPFYEKLVSAENAAIAKLGIKL